jgi:DNA-binding SARP family transcriptional activator
MHSRGKLAAFLWPDSKPEVGRIALRTALGSLRRLLVDTESAPGKQRYLLHEHDLLGLNPQAPLEFDLRTVQQVYQQVQKHSLSVSEAQQTVLMTQYQHALTLVRGPFLDGFWLGDGAPFDEWREQQQRHWHLRLLALLDRLSSLQEMSGKWEEARATLTRWVTLDPLAEEAYRRLMRAALAQGDTTAALQMYATLQARLAEGLDIMPSPETVALAEHSRLLAARSKRPLATVESGPPSQFVSPLLGRAKTFRLLVESFQRVRARQPQAVLVVGEAGIGKTRLAEEFVAWSRAQGADVLRGHAFEIGGRLPYQSLVEALRERLEAENAPDDLLEDMWLAELSRLLPELQVRYPDLPTPTEDELIAKGRLFEAVAQLLGALAQRAPLVLLVDDLQWVDEASLDLLHYLGHSWKQQGSRVLHQRAFAVLEHEEARASELAYHALLAGEIEAAYHLHVQAGMEAVVIFAIADAIGYYEQARTLLHDSKRLQNELPALEIEHLYAHLGRAYVFQNAWEKAQTTYEELLTYVQHKPLPAFTCRTLNRLAILAVQRANDKPKARLYLEHALQIAEINPDQRALAETVWNLALITAVMWERPASALPYGQQALTLARAMHDQELEARSLSALGWIHLLGADYQASIQCVEAALAIYALLGNGPVPSKGLSLPSFVTGAPLTQFLTIRASEAFCWAQLAFAQVQVGQLSSSIQNGYRSLTLARKIKNTWVQIANTVPLTSGLLDAGRYEEALVIMQQAVELTKTLPPTFNFYRLLTVLGSTYQALQLWEEAHQTLAEAVTMAEKLDFKLYFVPIVSRLCMHYHATGAWEEANTYALQAIALRKSFGKTLIQLDFSRPYEIETLLHAGNEQQVREEIRHMEHCLGSNQRFRIPYLRSLAMLTTWEGSTEQALGQLQEAMQLATTIGLPGEQWQIQAALGNVYETAHEQERARTAFAEAARIMEELADGIKDETLRSRFLAGTQISPVLQHARRLVASMPDDLASPRGL